MSGPFVDINGARTRGDPEFAPNQTAIVSTIIRIRSHFRWIANTGGNC